MMKKCQSCGYESSDEMRFCLECGQPLPDAPIVINLSSSGGGTRENTVEKTVSLDQSMQTRVGRHIVPPTTATRMPRRYGKIFAVLGGVFLLFLFLLTGVAIIVYYNWPGPKPVVQNSPTPTPERTVENTPTATPTTRKTPVIEPTFEPTPEPPSDGSVKFDKIWVDFNKKQNGAAGMLIHTKFIISDYKGEQLYLVVYFQYPDGTSVQSNNPNYSDSSGRMGISARFTPGFDTTEYKDLQIFMPYNGFALGKGKHNLKMDVDILNADAEMVQHLTFYDFWYQE